MAICWEAPLDPPSKLLLLALADHANDSGIGIYPGNARLARKVGLKERQLQYLLAHLENHGLIRRENYAKGGRGHAVEWAINVDFLAILKRVQPNAPQPSGTIKNRAELDFEEPEIPPRRPGESRVAHAKRISESFSEGLTI